MLLLLLLLLLLYWILAGATAYSLMIWRRVQKGESKRSSYKPGLSPVACGAFSTYVSRIACKQLCVCKISTFLYVLDKVVLSN